MRTRHFSPHALIAVAAAFATLICFADATVSTPIAGMEKMPQFPPSNSVLQNAVNELNRCINESIETAANSQTITTTDAVMSNCVSADAQLKQMLPAAAYNKGVTDTRQRVDRVLAEQNHTLEHR